jgi:hypothetical protein
MRTRVSLLLSLALFLSFALAAADDGPVTLQGNVVCAKCGLKEDRKTCQNVLQVKNDKGETTNYYIAKNEVADKFGEVCTATRSVKITGVVKETEGRKWIEPKTIEDTKKS